MIRVVHLSDLHICAPHARKSLGKIFELVSQNKWLSPISRMASFTFHDESKLRALKDALARLMPKPNVLCISGDLTTFGDKESFELALAFVEDVRSSSGSKDFRLAFVPGNHDNFLYSWSELIRRYNGLPALVRIPSRLLMRDVLGALESFLPAAGRNGGTHDHLANFNDFLRRVSANYDIATVAQEGFSLKIIPLSSVNIDPVWMNSGTLLEEEWRTFKQRISVSRSRDEVRLVLIHHNPFSAPQVKEHPAVFAYNATTHASTMMAEFQRRGIDIVLCGHQHSRALYSMDFINGSSGKLWVSHAPAACSEDGTESGFSVLDFESRHTACIRSYAYNAGEYSSEEVGCCELFLEPEPVSDRLTLFAHSEIRSYLFQGAEVDTNFKKMNNDLVNKARYDLVVVGQTLRGFSRAKILHNVVLKKLRAVQDLRFHLLVMDPDVLNSEISKVTEQRVLFESLRTNFAEEGRASIKRLVDFREDVRRELGENAARRISIWKVPRLVSFGVSLHAKLGDAAFKDGEMLIQILPLGNWREEAKARIYLEQRCEEALYSFYYQFILGLREIATEI